MIINLFSYLISQTSSRHFSNCLQTFHDHFCLSYFLNQSNLFFYRDVLSFQPDVSVSFHLNKIIVCIFWNKDIKIYKYSLNLKLLPSRLFRLSSRLLSSLAFFFVSRLFLKVIRIKSQKRSIKISYRIKSISGVEIVAFFASSFAAASFKYSSTFMP